MPEWHRHRYVVWRIVRDADPDYVIQFLRCSRPGCKATARKRVKSH